MDTFMRGLPVGTGYHSLSLSSAPAWLTGVFTITIKVMKIKLKLFATLSKYLGDQLAGTQAEIELPQGSTLADLAELVKLPPDEVKICFVNGIICGLEKELHHGDEVGIFPPIGGG